MQDFRFKTTASLAQQLAKDLASLMRACIEKNGRVALAVSGGRTPIEFFRALAQQPLEWSSVTITLVDERWLGPTHPDSNERLVREYLLQGAAAQAWLVPLKTTALQVKDGFMECETRLQEQITRLDFAVLGMGNDGHTASWFPYSVALPKLLDAAEAARCWPVLDAPEYPRMSLSWSFLAQCRQLFLHFEGATKNSIFDAAIQPASQQDIAAMPVRQLLTQVQVPLTIYRTYT